MGRGGELLRSRGLRVVRGTSERLSLGKQAVTCLYEKSDVTLFLAS